MTEYPVGTRIRYRTHDRFGKLTRKRPPDQLRGKVVGERDARGAKVEWSGGHVGSVLWDWIEPSD